jgi:hypothetical protein
MQGRGSGASRAAVVEEPAAQAQEPEAPAPGVVAPTQESEAPAQEPEATKEPLPQAKKLCARRPLETWMAPSMEHLGLEVCGRRPARGLTLLARSQPW